MYQELQLLPGMIMSNDQAGGQSTCVTLQLSWCWLLLSSCLVPADPQHITITIITSGVISSLNVRGTATSIQPPPTALLICPLFLVSSLCIAQWLLCILLQSHSFYCLQSKTIYLNVVS